MIKFKKSNSSFATPCGAYLGYIPALREHQLLRKFGPNLWFQLPRSGSFPPLRSRGLTTASSEAATAVALRQRFIQRLMLNGKKSVATKVFDESLQLLMGYVKEHNAKSDSRLRRQDNLYSLVNLTKDEIFMISLRKAQPWITTTSLRRGGKKVIIPEMLTPAQQESMAIRWLILNSRNISGKSMAECLASEFFGCLTNQGKTMSQREQLHKLAEANRAFAN